MGQAYIVAAARTAGGRRGGRLSGWHPADLAAQVINSLLARSGADPGLIEDVIMGCVSQLGEQSTNVARNAVLASKLPESVPATSIDRQCGSSQQALHFAAQAVMSGSMDIVIAAGVESMSRVPMGLSHTLPEKNGFGQYVSHAIQSRYPGVQFSQFSGAEAMARKYDLSKDQLDEFALHSHQLAISATRAGKFSEEIVPVRAGSADGSVPGDLHSVDEVFAMRPLRLSSDTTRARVRRLAKVRTCISTCRNCCIERCKCARMPSFDLQWPAVLGQTRPPRWLSR